MSYLVPPTTSAARAPTVTDDSADGYRLGWLWINTAERVAYILTDATAGAAVWVQMGLSLYLLIASTARDADYLPNGNVVLYAAEDVRVN
jgi:hypothetical protein